jgi:hypothetical protein
VPPLIAGIEKKSTGVTLISVLNSVQGIEVRDIQRTAASGSKASRYLEMQPFIASKKVTFTRGARHVNMCKTHMEKITANDSHRHDDICDTLYDGVKIALIDKSLSQTQIKKSTAGNEVLTALGQQMRRQQYARMQRNGNN